MAHLQQKAVTDSVAAFFVFNEMLSGYEITTDSKSGMLFLRSTSRLFLQVFIMVFFFNEAAFYGGTCLRIFHGLQRFSENLDFSLLAPNDNFEFTQFFQPIVDIFAMVGREVEIKKKDKKKNFGKVESAFLKDNTDVYLC